MRKILGLFVLVTVLFGSCMTASEWDNYKDPTPDQPVAYHKAEGQTFLWLLAGFVMLGTTATILVANNQK